MRLFKQKKSHMYYLDYVDAEGKRHRESTKTNNKKLAEEILARRKIELVESKFGIEKPKKITFAEFAEKFLEYCEASKKPNTYEFHKNSIKNLLTHFKDLHLSDITPFLIEEYKMERAKKVSPSTVNRELATLNHLFTLALKWKKTTSNPMKEVKKLKEPPGRIRYLSLDEMKNLIQECKIPYLRLGVILALNTGMRKGEILSLKKSDIDLENRIIAVKESKSGRRRDIPINDVLYPVLSEWINGAEGKAGNGEEKIFPIDDFRKSFENAVERAGIKDFCFHDLRHTFASYLVMSGIDLATVKELMGHSTIQMTMRYAHLSEDHRKSAVNTLGLRYNIIQENCS